MRVLDAATQPAVAPVAQPIRVLIVDDHELTCMGLSLMLKDKPEVTVVGLARSGEDGVAKALEWLPDVILMDVKMPGIGGVAAAQQIKERLPDVRIIMLTSEVNPEEARAAVQAKADAFCRKDISLDRLAHLIQMVAEGGFWLDPAVADVVVDRMANHMHVEERTLETARWLDASCERFQDLTRREREIIRLIVEGKSNKEIALCLNITLHTAKAHLSNIYNKLGVNDRTQVAVKALKEQIF